MSELMATAVVMPRQGNTVESCIIVEWKKRPGDAVAEGDVLCDIETDKAVMEVESPASGTLLELFFDEGDLVPVLETIAAIGAQGEDGSALRPGAAPSDGAATKPEPSIEAAPSTAVTESDAQAEQDGKQAISPRARKFAAEKGVSLSGVAGSGPGGRIIERDVEAALSSQTKLSPVAKAMVKSGEYEAPAHGTGPGGRVMSRDLSAPGMATTPAQEPPAVSIPQEAPSPAEEELDVTVVRVQGVRRVIAERMRQSLLSTAQLTMNRSVDARTLLSFRRRLKASDEAFGLQGVTINDLVLFVTARTLARFPDVNALFLESQDAKSPSEIHQYGEVHLAFAVDTPRGLIVPVIRHAQRLSLRQIAAESRRLAAACLDGSVLPDEITGGTFTVTNLGNLGVESFTPILNPPQVAILGVGGIIQRPTANEEGGLELVPHLNLSFTINHQVVDGAPGARFLAALAQGMTEIDLLMAV